MPCAAAPPIGNGSAGRPTWRPSRTACGSLSAWAQAAWREHGGENFMLEELERLDEEESAFVRDRTAKERHAHWCSALNGEAI